MTRAEATDIPDPERRTPDRLRKRASRLLAQLSTQSDRLVTEGLARLDARKWHYTVLASLQEYGPGSQATLSRRTGIYRSDMVGVLNDLAERELVERTPDPDDRRRNVITITDQGSGHLVLLDQALDDLDEELLAPLASAERDRFVRMLTRLLDHHAQRPPHLDATGDLQCCDREGWPGPGRRNSVRTPLPAANVVCTVKGDS